MRKKSAGKGFTDATSRRIRTKETRRDIRILDKADQLSGSIREEYVRTKEYMNNVPDDRREDSTQYAVDRSEETAEVTANKAKRPIRKGKEKLLKHAGNNGRNNTKADTFHEFSERNVVRRHNQTVSMQQARKQELIQHKKKDIKTTKPADMQETIQTKKSIIRPSETSERINRNVASKPVYRGSPASAIKPTEQVKTIKTTDKSSGRATIKTADHSVKGINRTVKTAERNTKVTIKKVQKTEKAVVKTAKAAEKTAQQTLIKAQKATVAAQKAAEATVRIVIMITKAAAAAVKGLITTGSTILIACLPAIILGAVIMGIAVLFTGDTKREDEISNTADVVKQINEDYQLQMDIIQSRFSFDEISVTGSRPTWEEVLSIYTAKSAGEPEKTWDEYTGLSMILWDMTTMTYTIEAQIPGETAIVLPQKELVRSVEVTFEFIADGGYLKKTETVTYQRGGSENGEEGITGLLPEEWAGKEITTILTVTMGSRSVEEMEERYGFSDNQKAQTQMLLSEDLTEFWLARIYGLTGSDEEIVKVALTQLGNTGGYPYWAYCGFSSRVEWCACFVSWCAGQCGYIDKGLIPNTGSPEVQVAWFKSQGKWQDGSITPTPGMIIFYDWYGKNFPDHVGIVEYVDNGIVHTVEGNSSDSVRQRQYPVGDSRILGYGWILE